MSTRKKSVAFPFLLENRESMGRRETIRRSSMRERKRTISHDDRHGIAIVGENRTRQLSVASYNEIPAPVVKNRGRVMYEARFQDRFNGLYSARFSPEGDTLATSFGAGGIQVRSPYTGELLGTLRTGMDDLSPVMCLRYNPVNNEQFFASSACGHIFICNSSKKEHSRFAEEPNNQINALDVSSSGDILATGGKDATVRIYDMATSKVIVQYNRPICDFLEFSLKEFHTMRIFAVRFHPQRRDIIISGGWDDTVRIWDLRLPEGCARTIKGPHISGDAIDVKEDVVLTGSWIVSGSLQQWDLTSGRLIETIMPFNRPTTLDGEFLYAVTYFDGDPYGDMVVVGGSGTGAVEVISLKEKRVLGSFRVQRAVQAIDTYRNTIAYGGMESLIRLGEFS